MEKRDIKKYLIVAIVLLTIYISYLIIKPFITALLASFVLAYLFYPVYKRLAKLTKNNVAGAVLTTILVIIITLLPLVYIANSLIQESLDLYKEGKVDAITNSVSLYLNADTTFTNILRGIVEKITLYARENATNFIAKVPSKLFALLITIYTTFALFLVGEKFVNEAKRLLPVKNKDELVKHLAKTTNAIIYVLFLTAIVEFILALIVFKIIGSSVALLLALAIGFLVFIPLLGPAIIWGPYLIIEIVRHNYTNAVILGILGIILFILESFVKAKITGARSDLHPLIVLIGTLGGISLFGFIGLIIGPIFLSSVIIITKEYYPEIEK